MNCNNCQYKIEEGIKFCPNCGQKIKAGRLSLWTHIAEFFNLVFNVEGKLFVTMRDLLVPGKLTVEYFKGKRITYFHPLRLFIVLAALFLASITFALKDSDESDDWTDTAIEITKFQIGEELDNFNMDNYKMEIYDSIAYHLIENFKDSIVGSAGKLNITYDSEGRIIRDKLLHPADDYIPKLGFIQRLTGDSINIKTSDFLKLSPKELIKKYKIQGVWSKLIHTQYIKALKEADNIGMFFISNSIWLVLFMMPFLALILKVLYIKMNKYYVEHLVFSLHVHALLFLLATVIIFLSYFFNALYLLGLFLVLATIYFLLAVKNYYKQSWKWTFLKFFSIGFGYTFLAVLFSIIGIASSLLLF